jgi:thioesterase domain-containing protein
VNRREFISLLGGAAAWPMAARAQQPGKVWRIGMLDTTSASLNAANLDAFRQGLRQLGYVEGQNVGDCLNGAIDRKLLVVPKRLSGIRPRGRQDTFRSNIIDKSEAFALPTP